MLPANLQLISRAPGLECRSADFEELIHQGPHGAVSLLEAEAGCRAVFAGRARRPLNRKADPHPTQSKRPLPAALDGRSPSDADILIGRIHSGFLWNEDSEYNLPPNNEICVIGDSDTVLVSSLAGHGNLVRAVAGQDRTANLSAFTWKNDQDVYLSSVSFPVSEKRLLRPAPGGSRFPCRRTPFWRPFAVSGCI